MVTFIHTSQYILDKQESISYNALRRHKSRETDWKRFLGITIKTTPIGGRLTIIRVGLYLEDNSIKSCSNAFLSILVYSRLPIINTTVLIIVVWLRKSRDFRSSQLTISLKRKWSQSRGHSLFHGYNNGGNPFLFFRESFIEYVTGIHAFRHSNKREYVDLGGAEKATTLLQ